MKDKNFFANSNNISLQFDSAESHKVWYHILGYGPIIMEAETWDVTTDVMNQIYNNLKSFFAVGGLPVALVGFHSTSTEDKDLYGIGFITDAELVAEGTEDKKAGLWVHIDIKNSQIAERVKTGELRSISGGFVRGTKQLAKTGETLEGWFLDHGTLTNNPRVTWLDKNRTELQDKTFKQKFIELMEKFTIKKDNQDTNENDETHNETGDEMGEKEEKLLLDAQQATKDSQILLTAEQAKTSDLTTKTTELTEKLKVFEDKIAADKQADYEAKLKMLVEKNIIPAGKIDEYKTGDKKLDLATVDVILAGYTNGVNLAEGIINNSGDKDKIQLRTKITAAFGVKEEK